MWNQTGASATLQVTSGTNYLISAGTYTEYTTKGQFAIHCTPPVAAPPVNDECAGAITLADGEIAAVDCTGATNAQILNVTAPCMALFNHTAPHPLRS